MRRDESTLSPAHRFGVEPTVEAPRGQQMILYSSLVWQDQKVQMGKG